MVGIGRGRAEIQRVLPFLEGGMGLNNTNQTKPDLAGWNVAAVLGASGLGIIGLWTRIGPGESFFRRSTQLQLNPVASDHEFPWEKR